MIFQISSTSQQEIATQESPMADVSIPVWVERGQTAAMARLKADVFSGRSAEMILQHIYAYIYIYIDIYVEIIL